MLCLSTTEADLDQILGCTAEPPVGWVDPVRFRDGLAAGHLGNRPMAAAFERAGYRNFAIRLVLSEPRSRTWA